MCSSVYKSRAYREINLAALSKIIDLETVYLPIGYALGQP